MITLYHASRTRSVRVYWLLEELGIPFHVRKLEFKVEVIKSAEYKKLNPLGKVPAMTDDGLTMFESGAMVQYILEKYGDGRLEPKPGTPDRARYLQWFHFAEATAMPPLGDMAQHMIFRPQADRIPAMVEDGRKRFIAILEVLEAELADKEYLVGSEFTAADIMMGYTLMLAKLFGLVGASHPWVLLYMERLEQRPAYQKAVAA